MPERYAVKVARTVLRGGSGSNATPLPDHLTGGIRSANKSLILASADTAIMNVIQSHTPASNASR